MSAAPAPAPPAEEPKKALPDSSGLTTATLHKEYGSDGGIALRNLGGKLIISHVSSATRKETGLKRGLQVLTMNNVDCSVLSEVSAQKLLEGDEMVTFLVQELDTAFTPGKLITAVLMKDDIDSAVGMGLKVIKGQVCTGNIKEGSVAADTDLRPNLIIKKINNFDCVGLNANQAAQLLADATGAVKIMAQVPGSNPKQRMTDHTTVTVTLKDEFDMDAEGGDDDLGVDLMATQNVKDGTSMVSIRGISEKSPFFGSALRVGMQIVSVQNIDCEGSKVEQVTKLLKDNTKPAETLVILARDAPSRPPGSFLSVVVTKASSDAKLGVVLATKGGKVYIKKIADGSLGSMTEMSQGMWVHSINNKSLIGKSASEAADILSESEGYITFLCQTTGGSNYSSPAQLVTATMNKQEGDKVGVAVKKTKQKLVITKNAEGGLASATDLDVGMSIIQINNVDMSGKSNKEAAEMMTGTEGLLTIIAAKPDRAPGSLVVASIMLPEVEEGEEKPSIGIKMKKASEGFYYISGLVPGGLVEGTELREGMIIKSVNNVDTASKKTLKDVLMMFKQTTGMLNVLAAVPGGATPPTTELVTGCCKTADSVPEGAVVYQEDTGKIMITETGAGGLMFGTALRDGMEVLAINNVDSALFSKVGLENLLKSKEELIFLAKRQPLVPDVLITEVLHKETQDAALGIGLRKHDGKIFISSIKDGTLASTTKFLPGMELVSIDNEDCQGMSAIVIAKALKNAVGDITIVASTKHDGTSKLNESVSLVTAVINKGEKDAKVGLSFVRKRGLLVITKIAEGSSAAETDLLVGMDVLSINNVGVAELSSKEASALLAEAEGNITILAKRPSLPPGSFITAAIIKEEGQPLGIKLCGLRGGGVMLKSVTPQSPASFTELEEGMVVRSINNTDTTKSSTKEVAKLLGAQVKSVTILAQTTKEVAMGRASYRSMRSLTSARSLGESIASAASESVDPTPVETPKEVVEEVSAPAEEEPAKTEAPEEEDPAEAKASETITVVSGGKSASFTVKNVVDC